MKKLLVLGVFGLLMASQAQAQTPAPSATPAPAATSTAAPAACEGDKGQVRKCNQLKMRDAQKMLNQKIADICKKQGVKGTDMVTCRVDLLTKAANAIN